MSRPNKPWYRKSRNEWYVTISGKVHRLGPDKDEAFRQFHLLMAEAPKPAPYVPGEAYANHIFQEYLDWLTDNRSPRTRQQALDYLTSFDDRYPQILVRDMKPHHVDTWIREHKTWGDSTRNIAVGIVVRALHWAAKAGRITSNPIAGMERPAPKTRTTFVTPEEFEAILAHSDQLFKDLLIVSYDSGARPQEVKGLEARHLDPDFHRAVFPAEEAKGKRRPRVVYFGTDRAVEILKRLVAKHPEGPLFRAKNGAPWNKSSVNQRFHRLVKHVGRHVTQYELRHAWVTRSLKSGLDVHTVAALAGHVNTKMIDTVYSHITKDPAYMLAQARRIQ